MTNTDSHRKYVRRLLDSRRNLEQVAPNAVAIIATVARLKTEANGDQVDQIVGYATDIWNLSQIN